jgi:hypothetical protein
MCLTTPAYQIYFLSPCCLATGPLHPFAAAACLPPVACHRQSACLYATRRRLQRATATVGPHVRLQAAVVAWPPGHPVTILTRLPARVPGHRPRLLTTILAQLLTPRAATSSAPPQPVLLRPDVPILSSSSPTPPRLARTPSLPPAGSRRCPTPNGHHRPSLRPPPRSLFCLGSRSPAKPLPQV